MKNIGQIETVISTDVLVLGGGAAGLCAAIKAKESQVNVLVVDKGGTGWSGAVPLTAGVLAHLYTEQIGDFCKWAAEYTNFFNNQDWTHTFAHGLTTAYSELEKLGVPFLKNDGQIVITPRGNYNAVKLDAPRTMIKLKNAAESKGITILNKINVVDLLINGDQVVGAIGFGLTDNRVYILKAKSTIIATGNCRFQAEKEFNWTLGEGLAMAYRAGAELMGAEFRNFYFHTIKGLDGKQLTTISPSYLYFYLENSQGEGIINKHYPKTVAGKKPGQQREDSLLLLDAMYKEVAAGRGPIYFDINKVPIEVKQAIISRHTPPGFKELYSFDSLRLLKDKLGIDVEKEKIIIEPLCAGGQGTIKVDLEGKTSVRGLWAAGDASYLGSGWSGSRLHMAQGTGIGFAVVSGFIAGQSSGIYASQTKQMDLALHDIEKTKEKILAPLDQKGTVEIAEVIHLIHQAVVPMKYNFKREAQRMKQALEILTDARGKLSRSIVKDFHELSLYHQAVSMLFAGELTYKTALLREESRGQHLREDFPNRDDKNWLKWIITKQIYGEMQLSTETIPLDKYTYKPS